MRLTRQQLNEIFEHCASTDEEVCGLLVGRRQPELEIRRIIRGRNVHPKPTHHFLLDAATLLRAEASSPRRESEIIGFYHSHPTSSAFPSLQDRRDAWPNMLMVIVAVVEGRPRYLSGWQLDDVRRLSALSIVPP